MRKNTKAEQKVLMWHWRLGNPLEFYCPIRRRWVARTLHDAPSFTSDLYRVKTK